LATDAEPGAALGAHLGVAFADPALLRQALTHRSYTNEHPLESDNEGLALLGDAVLQLVVTERLWREAPEAPVGILTPRRAELVADAVLARWAERIELGRHLRLGRGEELGGGSTKVSVLAGALEAVIAVAYLEAGLPGARRAVAALTLW